MDSRDAGDPAVFPREQGNVLDRIAQSTSRIVDINPFYVQVTVILGWRL